MAAIDVFWTAVHGAFGLVVGSFLNVVIWRLPRGRSLVHPGSQCPSCGAPIGWRDNIPVLAWILLRGRCRRCRARIPARYPLVEALTGGLFVLAALAFPGDRLTSAQVCLFLAALVAVTFIDLDLRLIPDRITKPGLVVFLVLAPVSALHAPGWIAGRPALDAWLHALAGAGVGAGVVLAIRWLGSLALGKEAMGLGDVKLLALIGAVVGPWQALIALVLGSLGGALIGLGLFAVGRRRPMDADLKLGGPGGGLHAARVRVDPTGIEVHGAQGTPPALGAEVRVDLTLPARRILEDADARLRFRARVVPTARAGALRIEPLPGSLSAEDGARLAMFAGSYKYIPFGPFLALGGAAVALYGERVAHFIAHDYPAWVRGFTAP